MSAPAKDSSAVEIPPSDPEIEQAVNILRSALSGVADHKRAAVAAKLCEVLSEPKTPQRAGPVLDNVIQLFRQEQRPEWSAKEVVSALKERGHEVQNKQVYSALTYLDGMRILRRIGYGRYLVEGGGILVDVERENR